MSSLHLTRRLRWSRRAITAATALAAAAVALPAASPASAATRDVVVVGNAFAGTVSFLDGTTFQNLGSMNIAPDRAARKSALLNFNLVATVEWEVVKSQKGGENYIDDMALSSDGKTLIVSRGILRDVVAWDIATKKVKWRAETNSANADHMAISPDGARVLVSASSLGYTHVFDTATGKKITSIGAGDFPHGVDFSADGKRIYIGSIGTTYLPYALNAQKGNRQLTVVDATTYKNVAIHKFQAGVRPTVISADESKAYLQLSYRRGFIEFDLATGKTSREFTTPGTLAGNQLFPDKLPANSMHHGLAMNGAETKLCNAGTIDNQIQIVDRATLTADSTVDGFAKPYWAQNDKTGTLCLVSNSNGNYVSVISYATGQEIRRVPVGKYPQRERLGAVDTAALATLSPAVG